MDVPYRRRARAAQAIAVALLLVTATSCSPSAATAPTSPLTGQAGPIAATSTSPGRDGYLVRPLHSQCDIGEKVLHYLATGDNGGDPELDVLLSKDVGVPLPQARSLADQQIQNCDAHLSAQDAEQASASASASAAAAQATANAAASADAAKQQAAVQSTKVTSCAAIGGRMDSEWDWCASTVKGDPSGQPGADCSNASVAFNPDGTLASWSSSSTKDFYPGCFRL